MTSLMTSIISGLYFFVRFLKTSSHRPLLGPKIWRFLKINLLGVPVSHEYCSVGKKCCTGQVDFLAGQVTFASWYQRVFLIFIVKL